MLPLTKALTCLAGHQFYLVSHLIQPASPVLGSAAGLHADQARRAVHEMFKELGALDLLVEDLASLRVDPVHLEDILGGVYAIFGKIRVGSTPRRPRVVECPPFPLDPQPAEQEWGGNSKWQ